MDTATTSRENWGVSPDDKLLGKRAVPTTQDTR